MFLHPERGTGVGAGSGRASERIEAGCGVPWGHFSASFKKEKVDMRVLVKAILVSDKQSTDAVSTPATPRDGSPQVLSAGPYHLTRHQLPVEHLGL